MGTRGAPPGQELLQQLQSLLPALNSLVASNDNARQENDGTTTPPPELRESQAPPEIERTPRTDVHLRLYTEKIDKMVDETQSRSHVWMLPGTKRRYVEVLVVSNLDRVASCRPR